MGLKELLAFQAVIEQGTFAKAAEKLHYAQSTVTAQIQRLEKELGFKLFNRGWEAELTEAGKLYAGEVEGLIRHWIHVHNQALSLGDEEKGVLTFGVIEPAAENGLAQLMENFRKSKPGIECRILIDSSERLARAIHTGEIDLALCGRPRDMGSAYFESLYEEEIAFIVDRSHPLGGQDRLRVEDFYRYPLIAGGEDCLYHLRLKQEFSTYPTKPFTCTVSRLSSIPALTRAMGGIGAVVSTMPVPQEMRCIPYTLEHSRIPVGLLWSEEERRPCPGRDVLEQLIRSAHKMSET
ncbi:LysR family transcriptional regulator [Saccharibacillus kuerlensis]|uniref:HTH lysR-type domain-containing protein n=1 Tax=Saccharibacillus kuerlensis TaxID=459527 RepID=A0ABQ2L7J4_9BACL|nr:LysR family transcriptional regulator [Saccharibacillus kuerlensis]GGO04195.1 hypothetical protein GCM10010969_29200 [Saccharibacillus kuerlensis]